MEVNGKYQMQVILSKIKEEGGGDPILILKIISLHISHLERQAVRY
jgi:hypothetical protein